MSLNTRLNKLPQKKLLACWIFYHSIVVAFFLFSLIAFRGKIGIDSDLFNLVPKNISQDSVKKADEKMMAVTSQNVFILVSNNDFSEAKQVAVSVYNELLESPNFETISLYNDVSALGEITDFLYKYRFNLIDEKTANTILSSKEGAQAFAMNALSKAYGGFTMLPLDNLDTDPFLLTEYNLQNYLGALQNAGTAMAVKDGSILFRHNYGSFLSFRNFFPQTRMHHCSSICFRPG